MTKNHVFCRDGKYNKIGYFSWPIDQIVYKIVLTYILDNILDNIISHIGHLDFSFSFSFCTNMS